MAQPIQVQLEHDQPPQNHSIAPFKVSVDIVESERAPEEVSTPFLPSEETKQPTTLTQIRSSPRNTAHLIKQAFQQTWHDVKNAKPKKWYGLQWLAFFSILWTCALITLIICFALLSAGKFGFEDSSCHPDGEFSPFRNSFNWWALKGTFQITLKVGNFDFATAKIIDVIWDLVVGRGGQTLLALISWRAFSDYLAVSIITKPTTYTTVWLLRFQTDPSFVSIMGLIHQFIWRRGLASRTAMSFMVAAALLILAFPTIASSMTGYTTVNRAYIEVPETGLIEFSTTYPAVYVIHDGSRIGLQDEYLVRLQDYSFGDPMIDDDTYLPGSYCRNWETREDAGEECSLQYDISNHVQEYGWSTKDNKYDHTNTTFNSTLQLAGGPLHISPYYIPFSLMFYYNWSDVSSKATISQAKDKKRLVYDVEGKAFNLTELKNAGHCSPVPDRFQWGFSFLQVLALSIFLLFWTFGIAIMWTKAHMTLKLNGCSTHSAGWKSLLEYASTIEAELKEADIDYKSLDDDQLDEKIQTVLHGGSISSEDILPKGIYSLRHGLVHDGILPQVVQWIGREKWWFLGLIFWLPACLIRTTYRDFFEEEAEMGIYAASMVASGAVVASSAGVNMKQRLVLFLYFGLTAVLFYVAVYLLCMVPGVLIGARAAQS
ncbi:hypothetical protein CEP51_004150 [Fusarium floridanum]|uniref:Uncharacterized protein n=1 Tax=Fusarium floridanum TaxID=1325733 RepID=A0A428S2J8_9HYPO|nr:hypothetical protein CEP51_004150 [Fusarium floridanum]